MMRVCRRVQTIGLRPDSGQYSFSVLITDSDKST
jgi:hypothetical protein